MKHSGYQGMKNVYESNKTRLNKNIVNRKNIPTFIAEFMQFSLKKHIINKMEYTIRWIFNTESCEQKHTYLIKLSGFKNTNLCAIMYCGK
jgi:hypothetical protein